MLKILGIFCIVAVVLVVLTFPVQVFTLSIYMYVSEDYDLTFSPNYFISSIPRYTLWSQPSTYLIKGYNFLGVESVYLDLNVSAWNTNGTVFFDGRITVDSLADQKIVFYREYQRDLFTKNLTVQLDAYVFVDRTNDTDIEKSYSNQWNLVIP